MKWNDVLQLAGRDGVFSSGLLLAGDVRPNHVHRQLSEWTQQGKLIQLRRGLYAVAGAYQSQQLHAFALANRMQSGSYVSLQSALAYYGMIPEFVAVTTSVSTGRPWSKTTTLGTFAFRHIKEPLFFGYDYLQVSPQSHAYVASPEKALIDLLHLTPHSDNRDMLRELRLQNLGDILDWGRLDGFASRSGSPKVRRAVSRLFQQASGEAAEYQSL